MILAEFVKTYKNNSIIVQAEKLPKENGQAKNTDKENIGVIKEIFGPKNNPYILIDITKEYDDIKKNKIYLEED